MEFCGINYDTLHPDTRKHHLSYDDITNIYEPMGFKHFKIEGRTWDQFALAITYCYYMIKPEYKDYVLRDLVKNLNI